MLVDFDEGCGMCVSRSQLHDLYSSTLTRGVVCMCVSSPQSVTPADADEGCGVCVCQFPAVSYTS